MLSMVFGSVRRVSKNSSMSLMRSVFVVADNTFSSSNFPFSSNRLNKLTALSSNAVTDMSKKGVRPSGKNLAETIPLIPVGAISMYFVIYY